MVVTAKGAGTTYSWVLESSGKWSDHSYNCRGSRDDIQSGGGEGEQEVRSRLQLQREQGQHTICRWKVGARGQIMIVTAKGAGVAYGLEMERGGKRSDHHCDCKGSRGNI